MKKIASISMLFVIMSTMLANPIMNIGSVVATTMNQSTEPAAEVATTSDTTTDISSDVVVADSSNEEVIENVSSEEVVADVSSDNISNEVASEVNDVVAVDNSIVEVEQPVDVAEPVVDVSEDVAIDEVVTPDVSASSKDSNSAAITPLVQPEEGICNDSNSNPPKFTSFVQQEGTNNFVVGYSGDTPAGYTATSITFNLNFDDKEFIATNAIENGNFIFDDTDREGILVLTPDEAMDLLNNMKQGNGNNPSKYTVTFTYITDSGITCTRTVDAEGFKDYVPVFPKPDFDVTLICDEEGKTALVEFTSDPLALYPSDSQIILSDNEGIVDIFAIDVGSITLSNPGDYFLGIDINHDGMIDESEPVSDVISFEEEIVPSIDSFNLSVLNNTITPEYDVSYDGENDLTATITINSDVLDDPIVIDITSDTFGDNLDAITNLEPGSYSATLSVDYGGCDTIEAMSNEVTIPREVSEYPDPTFDVTLICDDEGKATLVEFTFGDIEDPSGPYPSDAQIVLLDDEGVVDIFAIDTASITITNPGNYSIGIDIDGDGMLEEGDPVVEAVSFEAETAPTIDSFNLSVVNNTIIPEYSVSYDGENELSAMITIDSEVLDEPIMIEISNDTFGDNLDAIANLEPGVYSAMISVDYGGCNTVEAMAADVTIPAPVDEPPVNEPPVNEPPVNEPPVNEPPVNEPPKLVYTGLENNLFESIMLSIKESVLSVF